MSMNGFNNAGMGMGMGISDGMLGGGPSNGRFGMDDLQHSGSGIGPTGMNATGMNTTGMGTTGMAGMSGYPAGAGAMGAAGVSGFPGTGHMGNSNMLSQVGRDDELLISLLRERNQQLQGVTGGVVPNIYGGASAGMPGGTQAGILGNFNLNTGAGGPYDLPHRQESQGAGLAFPPYLMDARAQQDAMMRDLHNPGAVGAGNLLYDHQKRPGTSASPAANSGMGLPFSGFDAAGRDPPQSRQQQGEEDGEDHVNERDAEARIKDEERPANTDAAGVPAIHPNKPPPTKNHLPRATKKRQSKDAPRRPLSAYNLFFSDERERILKEREEAAAIEDVEGTGKAKAARKIQVQEMAKIIGERWRALPDEWRKYYQDLADEDMKRHKEAKKRTPKDPSVPKRPPTAFLLFSNKRRKALKRQYTDATNSDLSKMLSKTWREAPDSIRQKYMDEATELSKVYKADMVVWRKKSGERKRAEDNDDHENHFDDSGAKKIRKKSDVDDFSEFADTSLPMGISMDGRPQFLMENSGNDADGMGSARLGKPSLPSKPPSKKRKTKDPSAPKRPLSAFLAFSNTRRKALKQQYSDATNADLSKMLSKMWREAPKEFRQKFIDDAAQLSEAYKSEMAAWRLKSGS